MAWIRTWHPRTFCMLKHDRRGNTKAIHMTSSGVGVLLDYNPLQKTRWRLSSEMSEICVTLRTKRWLLCYNMVRTQSLSHCRFGTRDKAISSLFPLPPLLRLFCTKWGWIAAALLWARNGWISQKIIVTTRITTTGACLGRFSRLATRSVLTFVCSVLRPKHSVVIHG